MFPEIGWRFLASRIMKAGFAARLAPEFDVWAQARAVDAQVKTEQKVHWWPIAVGAPALALPRGYFLTIGATAFWLGSVLKARGRAYQLRRQLERDLAKRGRQASLETDRLIAHADAGDEEAVFALFGRWLAIRPDVLSTLELDLHALSEDGERGDWLIEGDAITRTQLVNSLPESGPTQRSVMGERSPAAIDKELAEVNAAAVLSVLWALFSGPSPQRVRVRLMLTPPDGSEAMQWVWLRATVNERRLRSAIDDQTSAVDTLRVLGGDVGRCFAGKYTAARTEPNPSGFYSVGNLGAPRKRIAAPTPMQQLDAPYILLLTSGNAPTIVSMPEGVEVRMAKAAEGGAEAAPAVVAEAAPAVVAEAELPNETAPIADVQPRVAVTAPNEATPASASVASDAPPMLSRPSDTPVVEREASAIVPHVYVPPIAAKEPMVVEVASAHEQVDDDSHPSDDDEVAAEPLVELVASSAPALPLNRVSLRGESFSTIARHYVDFPGSTSATWVAFPRQPATYSNMDDGQLAFYFRWRSAIRNDAPIRTDICYILANAYELLHLIGAPNAHDAARQLERLWQAYRRPFPELDDYLVSWTADLLATEVSRDAAIALLERALFAGAHLRADETMLVVDRYWAQGEFSALPNAAIALLVGDPHLFESKFYQRHNAGPAGSGWIDRSFREALAITDDVILSISGRTPRDLAIARHGRTEVGRAAFAGAVYDFGRKSAVLGTITSLPHAAPVANTYRNALRFVEDILRRSKGFPMEMSGAPLRRELATALSEHFATCAKGSRESSTPTENAAPVTELAALVATLVQEAESPPPAVEDVTPKTPIAADDVSDAAHRMMAFFEQPPLPGVMSEAPFGDGAPDDFGPVELEVLRVISREPTDVRRYDNPKALLREIANRHATTPWLLIHRVNQVARRTPFGNRVIDINADPPRIHEQAKRFVDEIIARMKK